MKGITPCIIVFFFCYCIAAQTPGQQPPGEWTPALVEVDGFNRTEGVEIFSKPGECNNEDVLLLRFINHNNYAVKVTWIDGAYSQENGKSSAGVVKSVIIKANEEVTGDCSGEHPAIVIPMKEFRGRNFAPSSVEVVRREKQ